MMLLRNIKDARIIYIKGILFLMLGLLALILLLLLYPDIKVFILVLISIWSFARFYYFAFYVIEHYVDSKYKYSGLWSFVVYLFRKGK